MPRKYKSRSRRHAPTYLSKRIGKFRMFRSIAPSRTKYLIPIKKTGAVNCDAAGAFLHTLTCADVNLCSNYTPLTTLYDTFAIKAIKLKLIPRWVGGEGIGGATYGRGTTVTGTDFDGGSLPATVAQAIEYGNSKYHQARNTITRYQKIPKSCRPNLNDFAATPAFNADNKNTTIFAIGDAWSNSAVAYFFIHTYYVTCYGLR